MFVKEPYAWVLIIKQLKVEHLFRATAIEFCPTTLSADC